MLVSQRNASPGDFGVLRWMTVPLVPGNEHKLLPKAEQCGKIRASQSLCLLSGGFGVLPANLWKRMWYARVDSNHRPFAPEQKDLRVF